MRLIEIEGHWVNPDYVTAIEPQNIRNSGIRCLVWVVGNSGYNTFSIRSTKGASEMAEYINKTEEWRTWTPPAKNK